MHKIKKLAVSAAAALAVGTSLLSIQTESASAARVGHSCTVQQDKWSLWHAVGTYRGYRDYYGPARWYKSDARHDCGAYLG